MYPKAVAESRPQIHTVIVFSSMSSSYQSSLVLAGVSAVGAYAGLELVENNIPSAIPGETKVKRALAVGLIVFAADQVVGRL